MQAFNYLIFEFENQAQAIDTFLHVPPFRQFHSLYLSLWFLEKGIGTRPMVHPILLMIVSNQFWSSFGTANSDLKPDSYHGSGVLGQLYQQIPLKLLQSHVTQIFR